MIAIGLFFAIYPTKIIKIADKVGLIVNVSMQQLCVFTTLICNARNVFPPEAFIKFYVLL